MLPREVESTINKFSWVSRLIVRSPSSLVPFVVNSHNHRQTYSYTWIKYSYSWISFYGFYLLPNCSLRLFSPDQSTSRKTYKARTLKLLACNDGTSQSRTEVRRLACEEGCIWNWISCPSTLRRCSTFVFVGHPSFISRNNVSASELCLNNGHLHLRLLLWRTLHTIPSSLRIWSLLLTCQSAFRGTIQAPIRGSPR
jgi:hypothetical protein